MSTSRARPARSAKISTKSMLILAMALTVVVLGLTLAIVVSRPGPAPAPRTMAERDLRQWESTVKANPDSAPAYAGLGLAQLDVGDDTAALKSFERAVSLDPDNWTAGLQLGVLLADSEPKRADDLLEHAAKVAPATQRVGPYLALGDLRLEEGDASGARAAFERAVADAPIIIEARVGLARALEKLGDRAGALEQYREAARFDPSNKKVADEVARLEKTAASSEETSP